MWDGEEKLTVPASRRKVVTESLQELELGFKKSREDFNSPETIHKHHVWKMRKVGYFPGLCSAAELSAIGLDYNYGVLSLQLISLK